jgi:DNA (cytosine-5)-methyltransferase 1
MADGTPQRIKRVVDSFAGGGGASTGIKWAIGRDVDAAINHDETAIAVHTANHPHALHFCEDVYQVDPRTVFPDDDIDVLWASPDCKHFSRAKGGKPVEQKIRGLAWSVIGWARRRKPRLIVVENVPEFITWGPLDDDNKPAASKAGLTFKRWVGYLKGAGYTVEWRELVAADYGAPTSRKRLFVVARCDGRPIVWPAPTHGDPKVQRDLFSARKPWRTAAECIDWSIPVPSIFGRKKPLAENTLARIARGLERFVLKNPAPFIIKAKTNGWDREGSGMWPGDRPLSTVIASDLYAVVAPTLIQTGYGEREGQAPRALDLHAPHGTVVAGGCKTALVAAYLAKHFGGGYTGPGIACDSPMSTVTTVDHHAVVTADLSTAQADHAVDVRAFMIKYFGNERGGVDVHDPLDTVTTRDRFGLVVVEGVEHVIVDIGMRMLTPRELARAQGFPETYVLDVGGTSKTDQVRLIGNSVVPHLAHAIVSANMESTT